MERSLIRVACALLVCLAGTPAARAADINNYTPLYEKPVNPPSCNTADPEVKIIETAADWAEIDNPLLRIFCVKPGDYLALGPIEITADGVAGAPRWLLYYRDGDTGEHPHAMQAADRALLDSLVFTGARHWVVSRLVLQDPTNTSHRRRIIIGGDTANVPSSNLLLDRLLLEGGNEHMIRITDASTDITLQNSLVRDPIFPANSTEQARTCMFIRAKQEWGHTERIHVVNNEFRNCTADGIQFISEDLDNPAFGVLDSVIENNDFYVTPAIYMDANGQPDPAGPLSCSENAIDVKIANNGSDPQNRLRIIHNRFWGYRQAYSGPVSCTNLGEPKGAAILTHYDEGDYVEIRDNVILDAEAGIQLGGNNFGDKPDHVSIIGNLLYDVANKSNPRGALLLDRGGNAEAYFNTIIQSGEMWDLAMNLDLDVRANLVVKADDVNGSIGGSTNASHQVYLDTGNVISNGDDDQAAIGTRVDGGPVTEGTLFYANNPAACSNGTQDGCVVYRAMTDGSFAGAKPALPTSCGDTAQDGSVTVQAVMCACTLYRKLVSGPELVAIPYCESAERYSPAFAALNASSGIGATVNRGIDDSLPPGTGAPDDLWLGYSIPAYAGVYQGPIPADATIADAGFDQAAAETTQATLDAGNSLPTGPLAYAWMQTAGPPVTLNNPMTANPDFTVPRVVTPTPLRFEVTVTGPQPPADTDSVTVTAVILDIDTDGMSDLWETEQFGSLAFLPDADPDGDGDTNLDEFLAQSNPFDGDVNGNLVVDVGDLLLLVRHIMQLIILPVEQQASLDVAPMGGDGMLDAADYLVMQQRVIAAQ